LDRWLALNPGLAFVPWTAVAACDGAAPMARARLADAAKAVIAFRPGTFMFMSSCGFQSLRSVATGLSPGVVTLAWGTVRSRYRVLVIAQSGRPEFLSDSGTGTLSGWAFRDAAAPASGTRRRAPVQPITRIR
jgi:hypothetical protein